MRDSQYQKLARAYEALGSRERPFDYLDVMRNIPHGDETVTERQVRKAMRASKHLVQVIPASKHGRAKYAVRHQEKGR